MQFVLLPAIVIQTERPYRDADQVNREIAKRISHCVVNDAPQNPYIIINPNSFYFPDARNGRIIRLSIGSLIEVVKIFLRVMYEI